MASTLVLPFQGSVAFRLLLDSRHDLGAGVVQEYVVALKPA